MIDGQPPQGVMDEEAVRYARASDAYIEAETSRRIEIMGERRSLCLSGRESAQLRDQDVIVVDDGIATGSTVLAALKALAEWRRRQSHRRCPAPSRGRRETRIESRSLLKASGDFHSVGKYYLDFQQLIDNEIIALLEEAT